MCHASSAEPLCSPVEDAPRDALVDAARDGGHIDSGSMDGAVADAARPSGDAALSDAGGGCGDGVIESGEDCDDGNTKGGDGCSATCTVEAGYTCVGQPSKCRPRPQAPGDVIVTEIMNNPCGMQGGTCMVPDASGEWFEVHNTTTQAFDLRGLIIRDDGSAQMAVTIGSSVPIPAGGDVVLGNNADMSTNGGVHVDYQYSGKFVLSNNTDEVVLALPGSGTVIDRVAYNTTFPGGSGVAMSLDPNAYDAVLNDSAQNWCNAVTPMPDGDLGSPGVKNPACP